MNTFLVITIGFRGLIIIGLIGAALYFGWKLKKRLSGLRRSKT